MSDQTPSQVPGSGQSERCTGCGNPMALDQRYCLNCGKRRGGPRVEFEDYLKSDAPGGPQKPPEIAAAPVLQDTRPEREVTPLMAAVGLAGLAAILIMGVLIGRTGQGGESSAPVVAATGLPTATAATSTGTTATTATVSFVADWPEGTEGFTIELATLPKEGSDGTAVEAAKTELLGQGAPEVGALDSDEYASLPAGNYVLYSGVYDTRPEAEKALEPLSATFPDAEVVEVSAAAGGGGGDTAEVKTEGPAFTPGAAENVDPDQVVEASEQDLQDLQNATGEEYEEFQKKLPPTIKTPGKAPPKDNKAPGGGSGNAVEIG
ncbi:MAG: hypothetical protein ACSLFI_01875 [Solirubrobacterales bacterium]